jgi:hypothetical protein
MKERSVIEVMVLRFTWVVVIIVIGLGAAIVLLEIRDPTNDTTLMVASLMSLVTGILGALLGLLAGKSETRDLHARPDNEDDL